MCTTDTKELHTSFVACVNVWHAVHLANEFLSGYHYVISERALAKANQMLVSTHLIEHNSTKSPVIVMADGFSESTTVKFDVSSLRADHGEGILD